MPELKLFNTLTGQKDDFRPLDPAHIRLYACGPTVYNYAHIGNARMAVVFDLLTKLLRRLYPDAKVTYVSNITDVDDKIIAAAASSESGETIEIITRKFERIYNDDMTALGCALPDVQPRATEHIVEMIAQIEQLIDREHAYPANGHVLFNVPSYPAYGRLSHRNRDDQIAGARVEVAPYKKDPADFVLWKPSTSDQPGWDSPWGRGRPGWHIECSAMAEKHLGLPFDIHGGGADLKFPHHENEIAQSCCAHGHEDDPSAFAKVWVHNGFLTVENEKMSKSLGNFRLVHDLLKEYSGEVLRLALLSGHYRQPLDWSENLIQQTKNFLDSIYRILYDLRDIEAGEFPSEMTLPVYLQGNNGLYDDLNTPQAISYVSFVKNTISTLLHEIENGPAQLVANLKSSLPGYKRELLEAGKLLGILQQDPAVWLGFGQTGGDATEIEALVQERQAAKKAKNFARADEIRNQLAAQGIAIEDTPAGPQWRRQS